MDLLPGEKITYNSISGEVFVSRAAVLSDISWKEGKIILYKTPIEKALRMLSKRFNVDFVITDPALKENSFTGTFIHQRLDRIWSILEYLPGFVSVILKQQIVHKKRVK